MSLAAQQGERSPEFMGGIRNELAQLAKHSIHSVKEQIECTGQLAYFIVGIRDWKRSKRLGLHGIGHAFGENGCAASEVGDGTQRVAHIPGGDYRSEQQT